MIHKLHFPQPPLSQFVENMWLVEGLEAGYRRERILPDGAIELIIDQAHFIKEFQTFSGLNPSAYLIQRGDYLNYIPIA